MGDVNVGTIRGTVELDDKFSSVLATVQGNLGQASTAFLGLGAKAAIAGGLLTAGITLPLIGMATAGVKAFIRLDTAMSASLAIMGDVSQDMRDEMEATAREIGRTTVVSAEKAAGAYYFLASAGLSAAESLAALPLVAKFAQAGMFDMERATTLLMDSQMALGLRTGDFIKDQKELARVSDVLVKAGVMSNATVEQLAESLTNKASGALRLVGKDVEEGTAVLAAYASAGVKGMAAGEKLNIVLRDLQTAAIKHAEAFKDLNISVYDTNGEMLNMADIIGDLEKALGGMSDEQRRAALMTLGFQDRSVAAIATLIGLSDQIRKYEAGLRSATGFTEQVAGKQLEAISVRWGIFKQRLNDVALSFGKVLEPAVRGVMGVMEGLIGLVERGIAAFQKLPKPIKDTAGAILLLGAVAGPVLLAFSAISVGLSLMTGLLAKSSPTVARLLPLFQSLGLFGAGAAGGVGLIGKALGLLSNPITIVVGLVAGLVLAVKTMTGSWTTAFTVVLPPIGLMMQAWQDLQKAVEPHLQLARDLASIVSSTLRIAWYALGKALEPVVSLFETAKATLVSFASTVSSVVMTALRGLRDVVLNLLMSVLPEGIRETLKWMAALAGSVPGLKGAVGAIAKTLKGVADSLDGLKAPAAAARAEIEQTAKAIQSAAHVKGPSIVDELAATTKALAGLSGEQLANIKAGLKMNLNNEDIIKKLTKLGLAAGVSDAVLDMLKDTMKETSSEAGDFTKSMSDLTKNLVTAERVGVPLTVMLEMYGGEVEDIVAKAPLYRKALTEPIEAAYRAMQRANLRVELSAVADKFDAIALAAEQADIAEWSMEFKQQLAQIEARLETVGEASNEAWDTMGAEAMDSVKQELEQVKNRIEAVAEKTNDWQSGINETARAIDELGAVFGGTFDDIMRWLAQSVAGFGRLLKAVEDIEKAKAAKDMGAQMAGWASGIGAVISLYGALSNVIAKVNRQNAIADMSRDLSASTGLRISLADAEALLDQGLRTYTRLLSEINAVIQQEGGVTVSNAVQFTKMLMDALSPHPEGNRRLGSMNIEDMMRNISEVFPQLAEAVTASGSLASQGLIEVIRRVRELGVATQEVAEYIQAQVARVSAGFNAMAKGFTVQFTGNFEEVGQQVLDLTDKEEMLVAQIKDLQKKDHLTNKQQVQLKLWQRELGRVRDDLMTLNAEWDRLAKAAEMQVEGSQEAFDRLGRIAVATFNASIASGMSFVEALRSIGPGLDELRLLTEDYGYTASAALGELLGIAEFVGKNKELVDSVSGLNEVLSGLHNSAFLTQEVFVDLGLAAVDSFDALIAQGATTDQALRIMQPSLQTLWELETDFGYAVDDTTQALIDQAVKQGLVGEAGRTVEERMLRATERIALAVEGLAILFGVTLPAQVDKFGDAINDLPDPVINPRINWPKMEPPGGWPEIPEGSYYDNPTAGEGVPVGGADPNVAVPRRAGGSPGFAFENWGSGTNVALHDRESVVRYEDRFAAAAAWAGGGGSMGGTAAGPSYTFNDGAIRLQAPPGSDPAAFARTFWRQLLAEAGRGGQVLADTRTLVRMAK